MVSRWSNDRSRRGKRGHDIIERRLRAGADAVRSEPPGETRRRILSAIAAIDAAAVPTSVPRRDGGRNLTNYLAAAATLVVAAVLAAVFGLRPGAPSGQRAVPGPIVITLDTGRLEAAVSERVGSVLTSPLASEAMLVAADAWAAAEVILARLPMRPLRLDDASSAPEAAMRIE